MLTAGISYNLRAGRTKGKGQDYQNLEAQKRVLMEFEEGALSSLCWSLGGDTIKLVLKVLQEAGTQKQLVLLG